MEDILDLNHMIIYISHDHIQVTSTLKQMTMFQNFISQMFYKYKKKQNKFSIKLNKIYTI